MSRLFYAGAKVYRRISHIKEQGFVPGAGLGQKPEGLVFSIDNGTSRSFVRFDNFENFEFWYRQLDPNKRTLSEVIASDTRKLILDIDDPDSAMLDKLLMFDFERHVTSRIHDVFFLLDIGTPNVVFYSMCSDDKVSYHAVVSNFMFSAHTCSGLCIIISSGQIWESCVDRSVYKTVQFIRIEGSTKYGEYRWKERLTEFKSIRDGLLSDPVGTQVSSFTTLVCSSPKKYSLPYSVNLSAYIYTQFRIGKQNKNSIVPLYRTKPGFCVQCNRKHDRENAFIKYYPGNPVFICWRYYHTYTRA
jgi:hypothetical protein